MGTAIFWAIVITGIFASRRLFPHWWARGPALPFAPRPALPDGLPPGARDARAIKLEEAQPGDYVAIVGRVGPRADLAAPLTRRPCVASDVVVADPRTGDRITRVLRATTFVLDTGGTQAVVDARGAFVRLQHDRESQEVDPRQLEPGILAPDESGRRVAVFEGIIAPGEYVLVIGVVEKPGSGDDAGYRASADVRLRIAGGGVRPSVVSTLPGDLRAVM